MRSLPEIIQDWRDAAAILQDQANQLEELATFFGAILPPVGVANSGRPSKPVPVARHTPPVQAVTAAAVEESAPAAPAPPPPVRRGRTSPTYIPASRKLTTAEKEGIRKDFEGFPPALRTKVNRAALAAKWNCSTTQIFAITRDRQVLLDNLAAGRASAQKQPSKK